MDKYSSLIFSLIVFVVGLVIFKAVFFALGLTLIFLLTMILVETIWYFRHSQAFDIVTSLLLAAVFTMATYILLFLPFEFVMTEVWMITPKIHPIVSSFCLVFFAVLFSLPRWNRFVGSKPFRLIPVVLIVIGILVYRGYRQEKLSREYLPKIYQVKRESGIQAEIVKISGVNFFPVWKRGRVILGGQEMVLKSWDEDLIIAEQPVPVRFGQVELYVVRSDSVISNKTVFLIKDPATLESM